MGRKTLNPVPMRGAIGSDYTQATQTQPSHLTTFGASERRNAFERAIDSLAEKFNLSKPKVTDLTVDQQAAIRDIDLEYSNLEAQKAAIMDRARIAMKTNVKYTHTPVDKLRLNSIEFEKKQLEALLGTIIKQESKIKQQRRDTKLLSVIERGNKVYKDESVERQKIDFDSVLADVEEIDEESVADQIELYERLDGVATRDHLADVGVGASGQTMGSVVDSELEELRKEALSHQEDEALDVKATLPSMSMMPVLSGHTPQLTPTAVGTRQPVSVMSKVSSSGNPSPSGSPFSRAMNNSTPNLNFSDELDWLK